MVELIQSTHFVIKEIKVNSYGNLVVFSGIDGSGKSTLCKKVFEFYSNRNCNVEYISAFEDRIFINEYERITNENIETSQHTSSEKIKNIAWLCDLVNNTLNILLPKLKSGTTLFVDRYTLCAKVYSLATTTSDISSLFSIYDILPKPDLCFYLDITPQLAIERIKERKGKRTYYENLYDLQKIQIQYERMIPYEDYQVKRIDTSKSEDIILAESLEFINEIMSLK